MALGSGLADVPVRQIRLINNLIYSIHISVLPAECRFLVIYVTNLIVKTFHWKS